MMMMPTIRLLSNCSGPVGGCAPSRLRQQQTRGGGDSGLASACSRLPQVMTGGPSSCLMHTPSLSSPLSLPIASLQRGADCRPPPAGAAAAVGSGSGAALLRAYDRRFRPRLAASSVLHTAACVKRHESTALTDLCCADHNSKQ